MSKKKLTLSQALLLTSRNPDVRVVYDLNDRSSSYTDSVEAMGRYKHEWLNRQEYTIDPVCLLYMAFSYSTIKSMSKRNPDIRFLGGKHGGLFFDYYNQDFKSFNFWENDGTLDPKNTDFWFLDKEATNEAVTELFRKEGIL